MKKKIFFFNCFCFSNPKHRNPTKWNRNQMQSVGSASLPYKSVSLLKNSNRNFRFGAKIAFNTDWNYEWFVTYTLHGDKEFLLQCCKQFSFFHSKKVFFSDVKCIFVSDPLHMYSYTKSLFSPSWQYPRRQIKFLWCVFPITFILSWNSLSQSTNNFSSLFAATIFWSLPIVPL